MRWSDTPELLSSNSEGLLTLRGANALCQSACAAARHIDEAGIRSDRIEHRQQTLRLRQNALIEVHFELTDRVVHAQVIIFQPVLQQIVVLELLGQAFENRLQLSR